MQCEVCGKETEYIGTYDSVNDWIMDEYRCPFCDHYQTEGDYFD